MSTGEEECAKCHTSVAVRYGCDFEDGDICDSCCQDERQGLLTRVSVLESEVAPAKERLGPAGYKILERYRELESEREEHVKRIEKLEALLAKAEMALKRTACRDYSAGRAMTSQITYEHYQSCCLQAEILRLISEARKL